jgi:hypothetical protein
MSDLQFPNDPKNISVRPLTGGMMRNLPANQLPAEAAWTLRDFYVFRGGLLSRPRYLRDDVDPDPGDIDPDIQVLVDDDTWRTMFLHWEDGENFETVVLGDRFLYRYNDNKVLPILFDSYAYAAATVTNIGLNSYQVEITDFDGNPNLTAGEYGFGDWISLDGVPCFIQEVSSASILICSSLTGVAPTATSTIVIGKSLGGSDLYPVQYGRVIGTSGRTYITGARQKPVMKYTISGSLVDLDLFPTDGTSLTDVKCLETMGGRIFLGNFVEDGVQRRNRIRWGQSYPQDIEIFDAGDSGFIDFLEANTDLVRLKSMGTVLIAYFGDQIYYGRPTNIAGLPYQFTKMESGNVGLAGPRAIGDWIDGHFFVGQDDIYFFSTSGPPQPIGTPVIKETIQAYQDTLHLAVVQPDPKRDRIAFIFPDSSGIAQEIWTFNYKDQAWSYDDVPAQGLGYTSLSQADEWYNYDPVYIDPATFDPTVIPDSAPSESYDGIPGTYDDYKSTYSQARFFVLNDHKIYRTQNSEQQDCNLATPWPQYESVDFDFGVPDYVKTVTRLSLKLENPWEVTLSSIDPVTLDTIDEEDDPLAFKVEYSNDRGRTWNSAGILYIYSGSDEGKVNFLSTGSLFRYRITMTSRAKPIKIVEVGLRGKQRGIETTYM